MPFAALNNQNNVQECRNLKSHHCEASVSGGTGMPIAGESNAYQPLSVPGGDDPTAPAMASTETTRMALMVCDSVESNTARRTADRE